MTDDTDVAREQIALYLRRPDGTQLDDADRAALVPGTLLVVSLDVSVANGADVPVTIGQVVGWVTPQAAPIGRPLLMAACQATNNARAHMLAAPLAGVEARAVHDREHVAVPDPHCAWCRPGGNGA